MNGIIEGLGRMEHWWNEWTKMFYVKNPTIDNIHGTKNKIKFIIQKFRKIYSLFDQKFEKKSL